MPASPSSLRSAGLLAGRLAWRAAWPSVLSYAVATALSAALPVASAWLMKLILDTVTGTQDLQRALWLVGGLAAVGVVGGVLPNVMQYQSAEIGRAVSLAADDELYLAVERFSGLRRFEDPGFVDSMRLAQQAAAMPSQMIDGYFGVVRGAITATGFIGSLWVISPIMMVAVALTATPMVLIELRLSRQRAAMLWAIGPTERREFFYRSLLDSSEAAMEIRLFGTGAFLRHRMLTERVSANKAKRAIDRKEMLAQSGMALLGTAVGGAGMVWAVWSAVRHTLNVGDVTMFAAATAGVQGALLLLIGSIGQTHQQLLMFAHFGSVVALGPDLPVAAQPRELPALRQGIELRDVWFRYSDEHPWILRGVSFTIEHGTSVALVGLNGAGKSTIVKLLCRFYDPTHGMITWDGIDLRDLDPAALRRRIGAVLQDHMDYDLSAAENIAMGDIAAIDDRQRLEAAAQRAGAHDTVIALPDGYDTMLTRVLYRDAEQDEPQIGVLLSGGQWQRIALARAFMRDDRDFMIFDEPTSGLDAAAEHELHTRLRSHREGRTSLLISHRLGSSRDADLIVVLDGGQIAERGTHTELMATDGLYAELFALQADGYRDSAVSTG